MLDLDQLMKGRIMIDYSDGFLSGLPGGCAFLRMVASVGRSSTVVILPVVVTCPHVSAVPVRLEISSLHVMHLCIVSMVAVVLAAHMRRRMAANVHHVFLHVSVVAGLKERGLVLGLPRTSTVLVLH